MVLFDASSVRTPPATANGGNGSSDFEKLAGKVLIGEHQFAIDYSVLLSEEREVLRYDAKPWRKARWWLMGLSAIFIVMVVAYQAITAIVPIVSRERRAKGPRLLNKLLGWFIHPLWEIVREGVVTSGALDVIYNIHQILPSPRGWRQRFIKFLLTQPDGQAVTNRLKRTSREIYGELERLVKSGLKEIRIASLACGSAQAMIEAVYTYNLQNPGANVRIWFVDLNKQSMDRARELARDRLRERFVTQFIMFESMKLQEFLTTFPDGYFHLVEMVGFLDYSKDNDVIKYAKRVRKALCDGGLFIGAMIGPNPWQFVVRWLVGWPLLIRRTPEQYRALLEQAWGADEVETIPDPHRIHTVSLCRKREAA